MAVDAESKPLSIRTIHPSTEKGNGIAVNRNNPSPIKITNPLVGNVLIPGKSLMAWTINNAARLAPAIVCNDEIENS